jgi:acyl-coenzyme A synthetase/AMP-(fatty) acid ligase
MAAGSGLDSRRVAFFSVRAEPPPLLELKRHCAERLPRHMIIDRAVHLDELPRTRNGKVDRLALRRMAEEEVPE